MVYHSTRSGATENTALKDHLQSNLDTLLLKQPNALVMITGDFNPNSTNLCLNDVTRPNGLHQIVHFKTRDSSILDWFLTKKPKLFDVSNYLKLVLQTATLY